MKAVTPYLITSQLQLERSSNIFSWNYTFIRDKIVSKNISHSNIRPHVMFYIQNIVSHKPTRSIAYTVTWVPS
jgi:hypothetical protein